MNNKIRKLLFVSILGLVLAFGANYYSSLENSPLPTVTLEKTENGVDVQIQNFKVENDLNGRKDWILKAKKATINNEQQVVKLNDVNVTYFLDAGHVSHISAEKGRMDQETNDIYLEGDVRFTAEIDDFIQDYMDRKRTPKNPTAANGS
ncbi:LPS export ABC transporter periplasmic protein LptC [Nitrospina watsonii]|uniref:LPS export ABC transporter periplasmic protein LptC n=1 Tax=Nitrospina watsonii TaxID=1323948 RepID=A0ABM9HEJ7_9BACT|nr:LPS export ABC transporter periplasmic protein LptC [Nitrospina watsonii]CAI2718471.1 conserved protein of unknown function [Nitrospina watsonii]